MDQKPSFMLCNFFSTRKNGFFFTFQKKFYFTLLCSYSSMQKYANEQMTIGLGLMDVWARSFKDSSDSLEQAHTKVQNISIYTVPNK
jgi:hypothetical protein